MEKKLPALKKVWKKSRVIRPLYWAAYRALPIGQVRHFVGARHRDWRLCVVLPRFYDRLKDKPVDPKKVLFVEYRSEKLSDNFRLIYQQLKAEGGYHLKFINLNNGFNRRSEYMRLCRTLVREMADAGTVFINDANEVTSCVNLRPETRVIQVWHACGAFKKWGMSTAEKIFGADEKTLTRHPNYRNQYAVTVSSPEVVWAYAEAMDMKGQEDRIRPIGVSRTDVFFDERYAARARKRLYAAFPAAKGKKVILYAPTFRGRVSSAEAPDRLDIPAMEAALGDRYVLAVKHHPYIKERPAVPQAQKGSFALDVTDSMQIEDLLMVSDICVSDYSSLVFEYSLLERPMLFFAYDLEDYFDWRGFYYSYEEMAPGPIVRTCEELITQLQEADRHFDPERIRAFREKFMSACDGHATERTLQLMKE